MPCPVCGIETSRVHAHDERIVAGVPLDGRRLRIVVGIRVDDFALRRRHCYATILIDAETRSSPATGPLATSTALPGLRAAQTR